MQPMCPFRNTGWVHYRQVSAIIPSAAATRGAHVFRPTTAPPAIIYPDSSNIPQVAGSGSATSDISGMTGGESTCRDAMVDGIERGATGSSTPAGPSSLLPPIQGKQSRAIMSLGSSDPGGYRASDSPPTTLSNHVMKSASEDSKFEDPYFRRSKNLSSTKLATKISPAAAVIGMQGSINRLTDAFEKSLSGHSSSENRALAIRLVQEREDELSTSNITKMITLFTLQPKQADAYLWLLPQNQAEWLAQMLEKM